MRILIAAAYWVFFIWWDNHVSTMSPPDTIVGSFVVLLESIYLLALTCTASINLVIGPIADSYEKHQLKE